MKTDIVQIHTFDPDTATEQQWTEYIAILQAYHTEREPHDPVPPADVIRQNIITRNESKRRETLRYVIYHADTGKPIGSCGAGYATPQHEDYEKDKHLAHCDIYIAPAFRRRGIGTQILRMLADTLHEKGKTTIEAWVNIDDGIAFQQAMGGRATLRMITNRLHLSDIDYDMVDRWLQEGADRNPDTKLIVTTDLPAEDFLQPYANLIMDIFAQMPKEDAGGFPEVVTIDRLKEWHDELTKMGEIGVNAFTVEPDGTISAMSEIFYQPKEAHFVGQGLTGVHQQARGRGLGKWVKAATTAYIREHFPQAKFVDTENANVNAAMLHINEALGFKFHKQNTIYEIQIDNLPV